MYIEEMKFQDFTTQFEKYWVFTTSMIKTIFGDKRKYLSRQISERTDKNKIIQLKKWLYTFNNPYIIEKSHPFRFANKIQEPSYISTYSALEFYNLIPEKVTQITSITPNKTNTFTNTIGSFFYQKVKASLFWWYQETSLWNKNVLVASPEKAILDTIYLNPEQKNPVEYFRLQHLENIDSKTLQKYWKRFQSKKIDRFLVLLQQGKDDWYTKI